MSEDPKVVWHAHSVTRQQREELSKHRGAVVWFTGLSGSGKSTIANEVDLLLAKRRVRSFLLDGDNIRHGLCAGPNLLEPEHGAEFAERFGLAFGASDREENIRRIGCVTQLFASAGVVCLTAFVSPYRSDRDRVRQWVEKHGEVGDFIEVYVDTPLEVCEARDPKGLYKMAREGKIANFTGISDPYEAPDSPEIHLKGGKDEPSQMAQEVVAKLADLGVVSS